MSHVLMCKQKYLKLSYSIKITWVLLHKKCTNLVYAKVSDVSKTEKVDSEEMSTKVKLLKDFQLQTESNLRFILYSRE